MITTGSKLLIGSAVLATIAAFAYGITQNEAVGNVGLISAALVLSFFAGVNLWTRDTNISPMDTAAVATSEAAENPPTPSIWPMVFALGGAVMAVGLVTQQTVFTIGLVIVLAGGAQWMLSAWADEASTDSSINAEVRDRLAQPLEFPLLGAIGMGIIAFAFSRVMLWLSKTNTTIAFSVLAIVVALVAFFIAYRPSVKRGAIGGVVALGVTVVVASGVAAGVDGERDIHVHETIEGEARVVCDSPEEFEVDEKNSQTVGMKASTYTITLTDGGTLEYDAPGALPSGSDAIDLPRSNPNNILFRNESGEERRLTVDLGPLSEEELAAADESAESHDEDGHGEASHGEASDRDLLCTSLVEEGGAQLLTVEIDVPSSAVDGGMRFFVPGTDAELELIVP